MPTRSGNENTAERRARRDRAAIRAPELVDLVIHDSTLKPDIRYATTHNLLDRLVYPEAQAFLQRPAAESLVRIHRALQLRGCGLVVFDGYRPFSVTKEFWDTTPSAKGSRHNRACVVDVTLCTVADGREVEMPSAYDEVSERASPRYFGGDVDARRLRDMLIGAMEAEGCTVEALEWWQFDYRDWRQYAVLNIPFQEIHEARQAPGSIGSRQRSVSRDDVPGKRSRGTARLQR